jgi:hypothetical protein
LAGIAVRLEVLLAQPEHLLQTRLVGLDGPIGGGGSEVLAEQRPQRLSRGENGPIRHAVVHKSRFALLCDQARVLEESEVSRHVRLRRAENACQFGDVEPILREDAQQTEAGGVGQEAEEG